MYQKQQLYLIINCACILQSTGKSSTLPPMCDCKFSDMFSVASLVINIKKPCNSSEAMNSLPKEYDIKEYIILFGLTLLRYYQQCV